MQICCTERVGADPTQVSAGSTLCIPGVFVPFGYTALESR